MPKSNVLVLFLSLSSCSGGPHAAQPPRRSSCSGEVEFSFENRSPLHVQMDATFTATDPDGHVFSTEMELEDVGPWSEKEEDVVTAPEGSQIEVLVIVEAATSDTAHPHILGAQGATFTLRRDEIYCEAIFSNPAEGPTVEMRCD